MAYENMGNLSDLNDGTRPASPIGEQLAMLQSELGKSYNSPEDEAGIRREISRLVSGDNAKPGAQLIGALGSPEANAALAEVPRRTAPDMGALSQVVPQQAQQSVAPQQGALAQVASVSPHIPSVQEALAQYMPQDDSRGRYLALAAGLGSTTKTGSFGEQIGNVASAMQQQKMQQEQMRLQYLPHIMQQVAAQQLQQFSIDNQRALGNQFGVNSSEGAPQTNQTNASPQTGSAIPSGQASISPSVLPATPLGGAPSQTTIRGVQPITGQPSAVPSAASVPSQSGPDKNGLWYPITAAEWNSTPAGPAGDAARASLIQKHTEPPPQAMAAIASGLKPNTPEYSAYMNRVAEHAVYIPPVSGRVGGWMFFADGHKEFNPQVPEGMIGSQDPVTKQFTFVQNPDIQAGMLAAAKAKASGPAAVNPKVGFTQSGGMVPATQLSLSQGGPGPHGEPLLSEAPLGAQKTANNLTDQANDINKTVNANAETALNQIALLNKIKQKALEVPTGAFSPTLKTANDILALFKIPAAIDMAAATEEANKASGQLVAGQSVGGMGTDQARALLMSITPNTTMQGKAIADVADNLIGAKQMSLANRNVVQPSYTKSDSVGVLNQHKIFTDNADYPLFEAYAKYKSLTPGSPAAQAYLKSIIAKDPTFITRVGELTKIGAF